MDYKINELIGKDLTIKMNEKNVSDYHVHTKLGLCNAPMLTRIKRGKLNNVPLNKIIEIYKAIGCNEISVKKDNFSIRLVFS